MKRVQTGSTALAMMSRCFAARQFCRRDAAGQREDSVCARKFSIRQRAARFLPINSSLRLCAKKFGLHVLRAGRDGAASPRGPCRRGNQLRPRRDRAQGRRRAGHSRAVAGGEPRAGAEESSPRALDADERAAFGTALMGSGNRTYGEQLRGGEQRFLPHARPRLPARGASHVQRLGEGHPFAALGQAGAIGDPAEGKRLRVLRSHHHHVGRTAGASRRTISRHGARRPDMTLDNLVLLKAEPEQGETLA